MTDDLLRTRILYALSNNPGPMTMAKLANTLNEPRSVVWGALCAALADGAVTKRFGETGTYYETPND